MDEVSHASRCYGSEKEKRVTDMDELVPIYNHSGGEKRCVTTLITAAKETNIITSENEFHFF